MKKYVLGILISISLASCFSTYQFIQPESLIIDDYNYSLEESNVEIGMDYDVLTGSSNKIYSKMEKKNQVSLIVINIQNLGQKALLLPEDLLFQTSSGDSIHPLKLALAKEELIKPVNYNTIDINGNRFSWLVLFWYTGKTVFNVKKFISHFRFSKDMSDHYLEERTLGTSTGTTGFLLLPVEKGTPLKISLR